MEKDLLVIGGGINGVGIAADAAGRGLSVILCEMGDLASGTSSASSRLIHGGLRYLENMEFSLVRKSLQERSILLRTAPHLIKLQPFVLPYSNNKMPFWMMRAGVMLYDWLAHDRLIPKSRVLAKNELANLQLKDNYNKALSYYDCTEDDSRLVVSVALLAQQHGAEIFTYTKVIKAVAKADGWLVTIAQNNDVQVIKVKAIVNATGPWVQQVANEILGITTKHTVKLVKGSHIIVPRLFSHNKAFILQTPDERVIFLIPYLQEFTLIGTTDVLLDHIEQPVTISEQEIEYLCEITNQFVQKSISKHDIIYSYAGIRPLQDSHEKTPSKITRDYIIETDFVNRHAPIISIFGGKITTYRNLSEQVGNLLHKYFPKSGSAWTKHAHLPGGNFLNNDFAGYMQYLLDMYKFLAPQLIIHYVHNYGMLSSELLRGVKHENDLGLHFGALLYQREVDYLILNEWARCAEDILWRRGKMGMWFSPTQAILLNQYVQQQLWKLLS